MYDDEEYYGSSVSAMRSRLNHLRAQRRYEPDNLYNELDEEIEGLEQALEEWEEGSWD